MRGILTGVMFVVIACGSVFADDDESKFDAKKLVGKWSVTSEEKGGTAVMEFTKDLKLKLTVKEKDKETKMSGTYKLDGEKLVVTIKAGEAEISETLTIVSLTDEELVMKDSKGKKDKMARVEEKEKEKDEDKDK